MRRWLFGFSLIELLIVIALLAIMVTVLIANISFIDRLMVKTEVEKLFLICRSLQQEAISCNEQRILSFDEAHQSYRYGNTVEKLNRSVNFGIIPTVKGPPASPTHVLTKAITFGGGKIIFSPDGIIQSGSVYLVSNDKQSLYALCSPVSQVSFLRMYCYDQSWHCLM